MQKTYVVSFGLFFRGRGEAGVYNFGARRRGPIDGFFPAGKRAGKRVFSRALRFSPRHDVRGAIVYFLIFLLFAFRRASNPRDYNDVVLQSLALDRRTIEREIRSCRVVFRFLLFNFFPVTASRVSLPSRPTLRKTPDGVFLPVLFADAVLCFIITTSRKFIYTRSYAKLHPRHAVMQPFL